MVEADGQHITLLQRRVTDLGAALDSGMAVEEIAAAPAGARLPVNDVRILPPVLRPSKIWALRAGVCVPCR
jgi:hypothetical protein